MVAFLSEIARGAVGEDSDTIQVNRSMYKYLRLNRAFPTPAWQADRLFAHDNVRLSLQQMLLTINMNSWSLSLVERCKETHSTLAYLFAISASLNRLYKIRQPGEHLAWRWESTGVFLPFPVYYRPYLKTASTWVPVMDAG